MSKFMQNLFGVGALGLALVLGQAHATQAKEVSANTVSIQKGTLAHGLVGPFRTYEEAYAKALNLAAQGYWTEVYQGIDGYWYVNAFLG